MNIKRIMNPRHTYDGYFETYFIRPFFHRYANFSDKESVRTCLMSILSWVIVTLGVAGIMLGQIGLIGPEAGVAASLIVGGIWLAASIVPLAALVIRLRNGAPENERHPKLLGVDTLLGISSILFFVFGLLMMITTLRSEILKPNSTYQPEETAKPAEQEYVVEEPIFTYQDETPAVTVEPKDTLDAVSDQDVEASEESFDPSIEVVSDPVLEEPVSDSI